MKFSVIIPIYNAEKYLAECLDSLLRQGCEDWEAICIDDGSHDSSASIAERYAKKDNRFHLLRQTNSGVSCARNVGLMKACGERVLFLDSDDMLFPGVLERLAKLPSYDLVSFGADDLLASGKLQNGLVRVDATHLMKGDDILLLGQSHKLASHTWTVWAKCFKLSLIRSANLQFVDGVQLGEDMLFVVEYMSHARTVFIDAECPHYVYRRYSGVTSRELTVEMMRQQMDRLEALRDYREIRDTPGLRQHFVEQCVSVMRLGVGDPKRRVASIEFLLQDSRTISIVCRGLRLGHDIRWPLLAFTYQVVPDFLRRLILLKL